MPKGISVYLGFGYTLEDNITLIEKAYRNGFNRIFTSFHIPEADYETIVKNFSEIMKTANKYNMKVIADISPRTFDYFNCSTDNLKPFKDMGIFGIRVDFGFSPEEISLFTKNNLGLKIEINASTVTKDFLEEFEKYNPNFDNVLACHNYYPRINTGISEESLLNKNSLLKKYGIEISAFIPSQYNKRGPIFEGLPTLESHRNKRANICAKHLFALGIDSIIFGDGMPSDEELESVGKVIEEGINLSIRLFNPSKTEKEIILLNHINRADAAEEVVRSSTSRISIKNSNDIYSHDNIEREYGHITIDNIGYLRYCGELQIVKRVLPADSRVNVVGQVIKDEQFLIDYIKEDMRFSFSIEEE